MRRWLHMLIGCTAVACLALASVTAYGACFKRTKVNCCTLIGAFYKDCTWPNPEDEENPFTRRCEGHVTGCNPKVYAWILTQGQGKEDPDIEIEGYYDCEFQKPLCGAQPLTCNLEIATTTQQCEQVDDVIATGCP